MQHLSVRNSQYILPMIQRPLVWVHQKRARQEVTLPKRSQYHHRKRDQNHCTDGNENRMSNDFTDQKPSPRVHWGGGGGERGMGKGDWSREVTSNLLSRPG